MDQAGKHSSLLEKLENLGTTGKKKLMSELKHEGVKKEDQFEKPKKETEPDRPKKGAKEHIQPKKEKQYEDSQTSAEKNY